MVHLNLLAYIDPGSGLLVWQMIGAAVIGSVFYLKKTRDLLVRFGRRMLGRD